MLLAAAIAIIVALLASRLIPGQRPTGHQASCGRAVNIGVNYDARPTECLWQAYSAGKNTHAIMVDYTIEGDPISYALDVASANQINVSIESQDRYGPRGSFTYACHGLTRQPASNLPGRFYLIVTGCTGSQDFLDGSRLTIP